MQPEIFVDILQEAMFMVMLLVSLVIVPSLVVGLIVSIFQAATSINEQTLSFLPRLLVTLAAIMYGGHWGIGRMMEYTIDMFNRVSQVVG
ncbi:flagellar biosynthesis protein FliQ [Catenovulum maritimum]|uniref:Flagellar biosynthetic protein FliQ n=1 Tax=Catenovulum maritimum TaxID=1513271 RepID=A0A0J8GUC2_9ALTE|nr:flagellar biosynthesis protein FliQ [Catenovulum maritimum]KMT64909.1 flagellar biosynthesis protein FliQ [Catenovulum maritimum]